MLLHFANQSFVHHHEWAVRFVLSLRLVILFDFRSVRISTFESEKWNLNFSPLHCPVNAKEWLLICKYGSHCLNRAHFLCFFLNRTKICDVYINISIEFVCLFVCLSCVFRCVLFICQWKPYNVIDSMSLFVFMCSTFRMCLFSLHVTYLLI